MAGKNTIQDLVKQDLCTGCGICVSNSNKSLEMRLNDSGFLVPFSKDSLCPSDAIKVCPFNPNPDPEIDDEDKLANIFLSNCKKFDEKIGKFENTYIGYSVDYRETSSSGGIATYIFEQLLTEKIVDHLYIVKEVGGNYEYQLFNDVSELKKISKTRYYPVTMEKLFLEINNIQGKIAISGVACFIKAIRLKQYYQPELREKIPFLIGIICGGLKSKFFTDYLANNAGITLPYHNQEYRIKDKQSTAIDYSFGAFDKNNNFHQLKMSKVGDMWGTGLFKANACDYCTDVLTELADISLGDAWLPEYRNDGLGNSIIITRTSISDNMIQSGIKNGKLLVSEKNKNQIIQSQISSFTHRQNAVKFRILKNRYSNSLVPHIRKRLLTKISIPYMVVQIQRQRTRKLSLKYFKDSKNHQEFQKRINPELKKLIFFTKIYHKTRKKIF